MTLNKWVLHLQAGVVSTLFSCFNSRFRRAKAGTFCQKLLSFPVCLCNADGQRVIGGDCDERRAV